jgi:hypothetical protein
VAEEDFSGPGPKGVGKEGEEPEAVAFPAEAPPPLSEGTTSTAVESPVLPEAGEVAFAVPADVITGQANTTAIDDLALVQPGDAEPQSAEREGSMPEVAVTGKSLQETSAGVLSGETSSTQMILPLREPEADVQETPLARLPQDVLPDIPGAEPPLPEAPGKAPLGSEVWDVAGPSFAMSDSTGEVTVEAGEEVREEGQAEEISPAFRAWAELFGEEPPELISRREEEAVRQILGAPSKPQEASLWEELEEGLEDSEQWDTLGDFPYPRQPSSWVSTTSVSWAGEETSSLPSPTEGSSPTEEEVGGGPESAEEALEESGEAATAQAEKPPRERAGRRRRGGRRRRRAERHQAAAAPAAVDEEEEVPTGTAEEPTWAEEQELGTAGEDHGDEQSEGMIPSKAIPSWEETVGLIIAANMENRARSHGAPGGSGGHSGHGRRHPRS